MKACIFFESIQDLTLQALFIILECIPRKLINYYLINSNSTYHNIFPTVMQQKQILFKIVLAHCRVVWLGPWQDNITKRWKFFFFSIISNLSRSYVWTVIVLCVLQIWPVFSTHIWVFSIPYLLVVLWVPHLIPYEVLALSVLPESPAVQCQLLDQPLALMCFHTLLNPGSVCFSLSVYSFWCISCHLLLLCVSGVTHAFSFLHRSTSFPDQMAGF